MDFERLAKQNGIRLRRLTMSNSPLSEYDLRCLARYCPNLEFLKLCLTRSLGNANGVALYNALGSIPRLVDVELELNTPDRHVRDEDHPDPSEGGSFEEFHEKDCILQKDDVTEHIKNGYVRETFINCALDKDLACAIFRAISAGKPKEIGRPIQKLNVRMTGGRINVGWDQTNGWFQHEKCINWLIPRVSQWWKIECHPRHDRQNDLVITKLDAENHPKRNKRRLNESISSVEEMLRRLWPGIQDMSDWENHWHSFPLAEVDKEAES
ncbi:uncharacterized protein KD926_004545 [Aspergillus affinis]|uniref:uncharacterized protein n=1 Tax=Aspergillus affinis TaxID=1070780 RepID=UPI0022FDFFDC|nr:uncharacterized protein KD926_004545 [Aspergillus affinis]KAI9043042.1 hypothetical protein KD926_004545 [Aspergillus affinis]